MVQSEQNNPTCFEGSQCLTCGYDLRALDIDSSCPECGTSIELSMRGDRLSLSDPAWVAKLARGQSLLVLGLKLILIAICSCLVFLIIGLVVLLVLSFIFRVAPVLAIPNWFLNVTLTIIGLGLFVGVVIATFGCVLVTTQDPRESLGESLLSNRKVARKALFAAYALVAIEFACSFVLDLFSASNTFVQFYGIIMFLLLGAFLTVSLVASLRWLANLAVRIPDYELRKRTLKSSRFFHWAILVLIILTQINAIIRPTPTPGAPIGGVFSGQTIWFELLSTVSFIFALVILKRLNRLLSILREYRNAFRKCAAEAAAAITSNS